MSNPHLPYHFFFLFHFLFSFPSPLPKTTIVSFSLSSFLLFPQVLSLSPPQLNVVHGASVTKSLVLQATTFLQPSKTFAHSPRRQMHYSEDTWAIISCGNSGHFSSDLDLISGRHGNFWTHDKKCFPMVYKLPIFEVVCKKSHFSRQTVKNTSLRLPHFVCRAN